MDIDTKSKILDLYNQNKKIKIIAEELNISYKKVQSIIYYQINKERILLQQKQYNNKEFHRQYYQNNKQQYQQYYQNNKEKLTQQHKQYKQNNRERILKYRQNNKEKIKQCYQNNKEKIKQYYQDNKKLKHQYYQSNKEKIKAQHKQYYQDNKKECNKRNLLYIKEKYHNDINFRVCLLIRNRLVHAIKNAKQQKSFKTGKLENLIGCSIEHLKQYIESKFFPHMTWDNHSLFGWHIDHIISCDKFDLTNEEERKKCFHYTNLQPLWAKDNLCKSNK